MDIWIDHTWKTIVTFIMLLAVTRFLGKEQLSQLTFYDYVVGITLGDLAGYAVVSHKHMFLGNMYFLILFAACAFAVSWLTQVSRKARKIIEGEPTMVIYNGQVLEKNMHKARYNIDNLITQLRGKGFFEITDVQFAILETDGELSVLPKPEKKPVTPADFQMFTRYQGMPVDLIMNGKLLEENLKAKNVSREWLLDQLTTLGYKIDDIVYASLDSDGHLYIDIKKDDAD